ncbi:MAG: hypothetical protein UW50_C0002G0023 [Candidatus Wolfebacteria bacterium GW2011_GWA1_44_24]|uniref:Uncharacterized protein n=2 Tax=Candidatus Wolfeibacteriota TaxID=1752735 RepID=A0A0G0WWY7_9BACT|nr:MAG: hypothetical protein UU38_C0003G0212 [Candidatus Wolfebacteria bacterium GW2011_GWB1_41_12]KKT56346.1 MAG: hypothetical protein UW50_C0002G0023 [Candidatus Wolfebacteria bacterium GW2011_GWA1_44_24]
MVEWQTRTTQNRVPQGMRVRLSPRAPENAAEPHRSKPQKNPKNIGSNHILILGEENFLIRKSKSIINFAIINHMNQKGFINIILVVIIVALVGAGAYFVSTRQTISPTPMPSSSPTPTPTPTPTQPSTTDTGLKPSTPVPPQANKSAWKTYRNNKYLFQLSYPYGWKVKEEYPEIDKQSKEAETVLSLEILSVDKQRVFALLYHVNENRWYTSIDKAKLSGEKTFYVSGFETVIERDFMPLAVKVMVKREKEGSDDGLEFLFISSTSTPSFLLNEDDIKFFKEILSTFKFIK